MDYGDMTIWQLKAERDKINAELELRTNAPDSRRPCPNCGCRLYKEVGPCAGEDALSSSEGEGK